MAHPDVTNGWPSPKGVREAAENKVRHSLVGAALDLSGRRCQSQESRRRGGQFCVNPSNCHGNRLLLPRRPHHQDHERTGLHGGP
jgi:hypothetical protein